ncbi:MAG: ribulose-phosphate 3-epimerase [Chloroflexota bacterium]
MTKTKLIAPSILSADFTQLAQELTTAEASGGDWVHIDIMDGHFVPNLTFGPYIVEACKRSTSLPLDVHLMIENPENHIAGFAKAGADIITIHTEASPNLYRTLQAIKNMGCKAGAAINPGTPAGEVRQVLHLLDVVLVMTVNPGYGGQKFLLETLGKITKIRTWLDEINSQAMIEVDGGINAETVEIADSAGAQVFVSGSAIFKHPDGIAKGIADIAEKLGKRN